MRVAKWGLVILLVSPVGVVTVQAQPAQSSQQEDSLAAAARRTRELKKQQPKVAKVWSNDNIPKSPAGVSVVGQAAPAEEDANPPANPQNAPASAADSAKQGAQTSKKAGIEADLAGAKDQIQTLQNDLDILRRKYTLDQQQYSSRPLFTSDAAGAANLKDEQDQIDAKQQELSDAQKKIEDLQSKLSAADSSAPPKPSN
jgi:DNA repair exonuclease SbcCD ATPase subunit